MDSGQDMDWILILVFIIRCNPRVAKATSTTPGRLVETLAQYSISIVAFSVYGWLVESPMWIHYEGQFVRIYIVVHAKVLRFC